MALSNGCKTHYDVHLSANDCMAGIGSSKIASINVLVENVGKPVAFDRMRTRVDPSPGSTLGPLAVSGLDAELLMTPVFHGGMSPACVYSLIIWPRCAECWNTALTSYCTYGSIPPARSSFMYFVVVRRL